MLLGVSKERAQRPSKEQKKKLELGSFFFYLK